MLSLTQQGELLDLHRSSLSYAPAAEEPLTRLLVRLIDEPCTRTPCYGSRRIPAWLRRLGHAVNRQRGQRLMGLMGRQASSPRPHLSQGASTHEKYPYLLTHLEVVRPDQGWSTDLTAIRMRGGCGDLVAIIDWVSRYGRSCRVLSTLDVSWVLEALAQGQPAILGSDQRSQVTSLEWTGRLQQAAGCISLDGKGRVDDTSFVGRLWRAVKDEAVYCNDDVDVSEAIEGIRGDVDFDNTARPHQALSDLTPAEVPCNRGEEFTVN